MGMMNVDDRSGSCHGGDTTRCGGRSKSGNRSLQKPSWLLLAVADMEEKMQMVVTSEEDDKADTFAERAEAYYQKRPQLLALLHDLYNRYLSLANRYCKTLSTQRSNSKHYLDSPATPISLHFTSDSNDEEKESVDHSDAESSVSYQHPTCPSNVAKDYGHDVVDKVIVELVMKNVEYNIMVEDHAMKVEGRDMECTQKIELQRSLLEVLESERLILLNENAMLGCRVNALVEENKGLGRECLFMKRKAGEMARCMLKMREEDHRVCMMSRRIEHLQSQIHGLEARNKEYYDQLVKHDAIKLTMMNEATLEGCIKVDERGCEGGSVGSRLAKAMRGRKNRSADHVTEGKKGKVKVSNLWDRVKNFDMFMCGPHVNDT